MKPIIIKYFKREDSPHIWSYNPVFENNKDYMELPEDFDLEGYQKHMKETRGKPTKLVSDFYLSRKYDTPEPETADNIEELYINPIMGDIAINPIVDKSVVDEPVEEIEIEIKSEPESEKPKRKRGRPTTKNL